MPSIRSSLIAYTYDEDVHCLECAGERIVDVAGGDLPLPVYPTQAYDLAHDPDNDGDNDGPVECRLYCGDCGCIIARHEHEPEDYGPEDEYYESEDCDCENCIAAAEWTPEVE